MDTQNYVYSNTEIHSTFGRSLEVVMGMSKQYLTSFYLPIPEFKRIKVSSLIPTGPKTNTFHITAGILDSKVWQRKQYQALNKPSLINCAALRIPHLTAIHNITTSCKMLMSQFLQLDMSHGCLTILSHQLHTILEAFPDDFTSSISKIYTDPQLKGRNIKRYYVSEASRLHLSKWQVQTE